MTTDDYEGAASAEAVAAADEADYLRLLIRVLHSTTYVGRLGNTACFEIDATRRRVSATRRGLRHLAGPDAPARVLTRLRDDLGDVAREADAAAIMTAINAACDRADDLDDAELHLRTLDDHGLGADVDATLQRHPAGRVRTAVGVVR